MSIGKKLIFFSEVVILKIWPNLFAHLQQACVARSNLATPNYSPRAILPESFFCPPGLSFVFGYFTKKVIFT